MHPPQVMIETVDSFQGKQLDVIMLSCVRASRDTGGPRNVGFVSDIRRLNVVRMGHKSLNIKCKTQLAEHGMWWWRPFQDGSVTSNCCLAMASRMCKSVNAGSSLFEGKVMCLKLNCLWCTPWVLLCQKIGMHFTYVQAITRAKRALWICGNAATLRSSEVWDALVECAPVAAVPFLGPSVPVCEVSHNDKFFRLVCY